jgi:flagellin
MYAENNLNNTTNSLNTVLQQLSSGSKINSGADDAAGLSLVDGLQANSQALTQSETNATEGVGLLDVADGALSQVTSLLNRAVTLATEASNGTLNASQDTAANQEYQSLLSEVSNIGSTTTYNDEAVFGTNTNIYTGDSSTKGSSIDDLNIRSLSSSNVGDSSGAMSYTNGVSNVFVDLSSGGHNAAVTDSLGAATATTTINVGYMTTGADGSAVSATSAISVGAGTSYSNTAQGLISAINDSGLGLTATFATAAQAGSAAVAAAGASSAGGGGATDTGIMISGVGIGTNLSSSPGVGVVGSLSLGANQTLGGTLSIVGADGTSHNITLGTANSTDTLANLESTINAANYGVSATVANGKMTFTSASSAVSVSASNLTESTAATIQSPIQVAGSVVGTISVANTSDVLSGSLSITQGVTATPGSATTLTLGTTTGGAGVTTDTIAHLAATINANTATTGIVASLNSSAIGTLGQAGYQAANTVLTMTKADAANNTAGASSAPVVDLGTPVVTTTGITTAALVNSSTLSIAAGANGSLGSLTVAQAGDKVGGTIDIMNGASTPVAANIDLTTTSATLTTIMNDINNVGGANNYGDGIAAVLNSAGTTLTFYEEGTQASLPTISASDLTDTTPAGTGTLAASGSGTASLGSLTASSATDVLNGTLNITPFNSTTSSSLTLTNQTLAEVAATINGNSTYGITASLNQAGTVLSFTATSTDPSSDSNPSIANSGNITDTTPAVVTNLTVGNLPTPGVADASQLGTVAMSGTLSGSITLGAKTITIGATDNSAATLASTINAGNYGVTASYASGEMTFSSANSAMTVGTTTLDSTAVANDGSVGAMVTTGATTTSNYYSLGIGGTVADTSTGGSTATNVGITTDSDGSGGTAVISYSDAAGQSLGATDLTNQTDAQAALKALNTAITDVASQDGYIGAQINTLNAVSSVLSTQQENVVSAQNAVQATDYASATSNMSKYEILSQTGIAALAQANSMSQEVTKLLQ